MSAVLLLDMNGPSAEVAWLRDAAAGFVEAMAGDDRVRIGTFGEEIFISSKLTGDRAYLQWLLRDELWAAAASPVWHAIVRGISSLDDVPGRRTVVVLSNGYASVPSRVRAVGAGDAIEHAERARAGVHIITFERDSIDAGLRRIAERTGGRFTKIADLSLAPRALAEVVEELHAQYTLGFLPPEWDGDTHAIEVRVRRPGVTVRAPTRYRAEGRK